MPSPDDYRRIDSLGFQGAGMENLWSMSQSGVEVWLSLSEDGLIRLSATDTEAERYRAISEHHESVGQALDRVLVLVLAIRNLRRAA